jgi:hypothetical protein
MFELKMNKRSDVSKIKTLLTNASTKWLIEQIESHVYKLNSKVNDITI